MASIELQKRWRVTAAILRFAQRALPPEHRPVYTSLEAAFNEYLAHNELECALETLADIGDLVPCRGGFWRDLERAALTMGLGERAAHFRARFLSTRPNPD